MIYRLIICVRRVSWLPPLWPNRVCVIAESPEGTTWESAYDLARELADGGAISVTVQENAA